VPLLTVVCRASAHWLSGLQQFCSFSTAPAVPDQQTAWAG